MFQVSYMDMTDTIPSSIWGCGTCMYFYLLKSSLCQSYGTWWIVSKHLTFNYSYLEWNWIISLINLNNTLLNIICTSFNSWLLLLKLIFSLLTSLHFILYQRQIFHLAWECQYKELEAKLRSVLFHTSFFHYISFT